MSDVATVTIERVTLRTPLPAPLVELVLERPAAGGSWAGPTIEVSGWLLGATSSAGAGGTTAAAEAIEVLHAGRVLSRLPLHARRRDGELPPPGWPHGAASSFGGLLSTLGLPTQLTLELAVQVAGARVVVAELAARREPLHLEFEPGLRPLRVTSAGGRPPAALLALLGAHPRIVALPGAAAASGAASYWLDVLARLAQPPSGSAPGAGGVAAPAVGEAEVEADDEEGEETFLPAMPPELAREPRPGVGLYVQRSAELCLRNVESWYQALARGQVKDRVRHYAESFVPGRILRLARELYGEERELCVVRDPRDWITAGLDGGVAARAAGRRRVDGAAEATLRQRARVVVELAADWEARRPASHLVRYEDLVGRPQATARGILEHLGLDAAVADVTALLEEVRCDLRSHPARTRAIGTGDGIGRWRERIDPAHHDLVAELLAAPLASFGYGVDRAAAGSPAVVAAAPRAAAEPAAMRTRGERW